MREGLRRAFAVPSLTSKLDPVLRDQTPAGNDASLSDRLVAALLSRVCRLSRLPLVPPDKKCANFRPEISEDARLQIDHRAGEIARARLLVSRVGDHVGRPVCESPRCFNGNIGIEPLQDGAGRESRRWQAVAIRHGGKTERSAANQTAQQRAAPNSQLLLRCDAQRCANKNEAGGKDNRCSGDRLCQPGDRQRD